MNHEAIIKAAALALPDFWDDDDRLGTARIILAAVTPLIRAAALEEAAMVAESWGNQHPVSYAAAAAIRALKEQP